MTGNGTPDQGIGGGLGFRRRSGIEADRKHLGGVMPQLIAINL